MSEIIHVLGLGLFAAMIAVAWDGLRDAFDCLPSAIDMSPPNQDHKDKSRRKLLANMEEPRTLMSHHRAGPRRDGAAATCDDRAQKRVCLYV